MTTAAAGHPARRNVFRWKFFAAKPQFRVGATVSRTGVTSGAEGDMLRASTGPVRPGNDLQFLAIR